MDSYFRFLPTEEELVSHYLREKKQVDHIIPEIDICKHEPWDVPGLYAGLFTEPESPYQDMFFFSPRVYKYNNSARIERTTALGFWKITAKERVIKARGSTGRKKTLTFYEGHVRQSKKTNWVMYEYYLVEDEANPNPQLAQQRDFVLCRLKRKTDDKKHTSIYAEAEPAYDERQSISELQDYMLQMGKEVGDV